MAETSGSRGVGAYANTCLTVITGCLVYLCYWTIATNAPAREQVVNVPSNLKPTRVEIVGIASDLSSPIPCKLMYKEDSRGFVRQTQWTDDGTLRVQLAGAETSQQRMQVEIVDVASNIKNALPITTQREKGGLFGVASKDEPIAVRLVGIERPVGGGEWHAIPVRGPAVFNGEKGGMIGSFPVEVRVAK